MNAIQKKKLNSLVLSTPRGVVLSVSWLKSCGYSLSLLQSYRDSRWLKSIGYGACIFHGDKVDHFGGLYSLQAHNGSSIHIGGRSALSLLGKAQYLELHPKSVLLFSSSEDPCLPLWFSEYDWGLEIKRYSTDFLPPNLGLVDFEVKEFSVKISGAARALMECLYLTPKYQDLTECLELMEGMHQCNPRKVQKLLVHCSSIKVKRLFLYLAEKVGHTWFDFLDLSKINLGKGNRKLIEQGYLDKKYLITLPRSWSRKREKV